MHLQPANLAPVVQFPQPRAEDLPDNLTPAQAAAWAGYTGGTKSFLKTARATGLTVWELNARVLRIDREELLRWRRSRTV